MTPLPPHIRTPDRAEVAYYIRRAQTLRAEVLAGFVRDLLRRPRSLPGAVADRAAPPRHAA